MAYQNRLMTLLIPESALRGVIQVVNGSGRMNRAETKVALASLHAAAEEQSPTDKFYRVESAMMDYYPPDLQDFNPATRGGFLLATRFSFDTCDSKAVCGVKIGRLESWAQGQARLEAAMHAAGGMARWLDDCGLGLDTRGLFKMAEELAESGAHGEFEADVPAWEDEDGPPAKAILAIYAALKPMPDKGLARILRKLRAAKPRASIVYAQIVLRLIERGGSARQAELCVDFGGGTDSSTIPQVVADLEAMGIVTVERGKKRDGNLVRLVRE